MNKVKELKQPKQIVTIKCKNDKTAVVYCRCKDNKQLIWKLIDNLYNNNKKFYKFVTSNKGIASLSYKFWIKEAPYLHTQYKVPIFIDKSFTVRKRDHMCDPAIFNKLQKYCGHSIVEQA